MQQVEMAGDLSVMTWDDDAPVLGFQVAAFNWRLRRAREAKGWSRKALAEHASISQGMVGDAEKLRRVSANARERMALALGVPEDVLFPGEIDALPEDGPPLIELSLTREDIRSLEERDAHADMIEGTERASLIEQITAALDTLPPREARVIQFRYGLKDGSSRTYDEIGQQFGVTRERIRQLEEAALRRLRRSGHAMPLRQYLDDGVRSVPSVSASCPAGSERCAVDRPMPPWMRATLDTDSPRRPPFWCDRCWERTLLRRSILRDEQRRQSLPMTVETILVCHACRREAVFGDGASPQPCPCGQPDPMGRSGWVYRTVEARTAS